MKIVGTWNSSYESGEKCDWTDVRDALSNGDIQASLLVSHLFDSDDLVEGLNLMKEHREPYCKVMILWGDD